jgi:hypothetical protein
MKIKVIKKNSAAANASENRAVIRDARESARDMVATVSDWVTEFKARKSAETKAAVDVLLGSNAATNQS